MTVQMLVDWWDGSLVVRLVFYLVEMSDDRLVVQTVERLVE